MQEQDWAGYSGVCQRLNMIDDEKSTGTTQNIGYDAMIVIW